MSRKQDLENLRECIEHLKAARMPTGLTAQGWYFGVEVNAKINEALAAASALVTADDLVFLTDKP